MNKWFVVLLHISTVLISGCAAKIKAQAAISPQAWALGKSLTLDKVVKSGGLSQEELGELLLQW
jgi:hypothetical protein